MLNLTEILSAYPESLQMHRAFVLREYLQYKILEILFDGPFASKFFWYRFSAFQIREAKLWLLAHETRCIQFRAVTRSNPGPVCPYKRWRNGSRREPTFYFIRPMKRKSGCFYQLLSRQFWVKSTLLRKLKPLIGEVNHAVRPKWRRCGFWFLYLFKSIANPNGYKLFSISKIQ